ncbi:MAG: phosphonate ABC transporter ATP-binding protein [Pyrinomonadaceae bacterium]|nr:phosphonate ABC transporter ATP-binding protein [Pyrinomonadaceae bacterium]MBA3571358.1 phosphonate ABC transporter ATP-binding protein [Pyrinomonadaceae bacterium]
MYSLKDVCKSYGTRNGAVRALEGLTFDVQKGERVALLGPSGAGKTTLFRLFNATLRPSSGGLRFDGRDLTVMSGRDLRSTRRRIGTIYQQPHLVPSLSALQNTLCGRLGSWSLIHTVRNIVRPNQSDNKQAIAALESVGLADKQNARADELSGGQQQRLTIARVLMQDPEVILADEPFASLDPALTETVGLLLINLVTNGKRTLVATMHDVELALRLFPRIIGIRHGHIVFDKPAVRVDHEAIRALYAGEQVTNAARLDSENWPEAAKNESSREPSCAR